MVGTSAGDGGAIEAEREEGGGGWRGECGVTLFLFYSEKAATIYNCIIKKRRGGLRAHAGRGWRPVGVGGRGGGCLARDDAATLLAPNVPLCSY